MVTCNAVDNIISSVRSSNLNYSFQETPYSLYLTIRKTEVKRNHASGGQQSGQQVEKHDVEALKLKNLSLKSCIHDLEEKLQFSNTFALGSFEKKFGSENFFRSDKF